MSAALLAPSDAHLFLVRANIIAIHKASGGTYGSPRVYAVLRERGLHVSRKCVETIMREASIQGTRIRKRPGNEIDYPDNLLLETDPVHGFKRRNFKVHTLDTVWLSDVTYIPTSEGFLYLAAVLDLCSRRLVGWALGATQDVTLTLAALHAAAFSRLPERGLIVHSDRGSQYSAADYRQALACLGFRQSMSRLATCLDNAPMESFFGTVKRELRERLRNVNREQARAAIEGYIEHYNLVRPHRSLGHVSPATFERARRGAAT